jgi:hypothetical protein
MQNNKMSATPVVNVLNNVNAAGMSLSTAILYGVSGYSTYVITDLAVPNQTKREKTSNRILSMVSWIPIIGSIAELGDAIVIMIDGVVSFSWLVGTVGGIATYALSEDALLGFIGAMSSGVVYALTKS